MDDTERAPAVDSTDAGLVTTGDVQEQANAVDTTDAWVERKAHVESYPARDL